MGKQIFHRINLIRSKNIINEKQLSFIHIATTPTIWILYYMESLENNKSRGYGYVNLSYHPYRRWSHMLGDAKSHINLSGIHLLDHHKGSRDRVDNVIVSLLPQSFGVLSVKHAKCDSRDKVSSARNRWIFIRDKKFKFWPFTSVVPKRDTTQTNSIYHVMHTII